MRLIGTSRISNASEPAKSWLSIWYAEVKHAKWKSNSDIKNQFPTVTHTNETKFTFDISDSNLLLDTEIYLDKGIALVSGIRKKK